MIIEFSCLRKIISHYLTAFLLICWLIPAGRVSAVDLIAHAGVSSQTLTVSTVRSLYGMRQLSWSDGTPAHVFVLAEQNALHTEFCKEILAIYPYQLQQTWARLVYSGTGQAPIEVASEQEMIERVSSTPGAIGYVNKVINNDRIHKIAIR